MNFRTEAISDTQDIRGILFPASVRFRQLLVSGPPGAGKTMLINQIKGWPEEGYIDLSMDGWWRMQHLTLRPREIHLGIPFQGVEEALSVFEKNWLEAGEPTLIDPARIKTPPPKRWFFSVDWRNRYVFEFLLRPVAEVFAARRERARRYTHHVDENITLEQVERQYRIYRNLAGYFHQAGLRVYIRDEWSGPPKCIVLEEGHGLAG